MGEAKRRKALDKNYGKPKAGLLYSQLRRPIEVNKIHYYAITERPSEIGYEAPYSLSLPYIDLIPNLPRSIIQVVDPTSWCIDSIKNQLSPNIEFSILFDDYKIQDYKEILNTPIKIIVIFLYTKRKAIISVIESLNREFLLVPGNESINKIVSYSSTLKKRCCKSYDALNSNLMNLALKELDISFETLQKNKLRLVEEDKTALNDIGVNKDLSMGFSPCSTNIFNINSIFWGLTENLFNIDRDATPSDERISELIKTASSLFKISRFIRAIGCSGYFENKINPTEYDPGTILIYPYFNPHYKKELNRLSKKAKGEDRIAIKEFKRTRFIEQNIKDYNYVFECEDKPSKMLNYSLKIIHNHTRILDFSGYLHSTFKFSPCIRVPARGQSLNHYISRVSPQQYKKSNNILSLSNNIFEVGKALKDNCPIEILDFLEKNSDSILAISDLPIEWLSIKNVPLSFLCDICRLPETGLTSLIAQFNHNSQHRFTISKNIISKTLIVCGASKNDPISETFNSVFYTKSEKAKDRLLFTAKRVNSKNDFLNVINKFKPELLIIDSHGNFDTQEEGSYIWMGDEKVTGEDIKNHTPQIPLVILSCCLTAPLYGNSNTIAQAFFERGSFSVLSTFLPISVDKGFMLYYRILNNLIYACKKRVHHTWASFISHNLRTSYFEDLIGPCVERYGQGIVSKDKITIEKTKWLLMCTDREKRINAYLEVKEVIIKCIKDEYQERVKSFLEKQNYLPDSMIYTHMGRGELIDFEV